MPPPSGPGRRRRLYEVLADRIVDFVEAQGLNPGQRLPPERLLAAEMGVSRATLSQALVALEVRGMVDVRHGDGVVVNAPHGPVAGTAPGPLLEARLVIEPELAALAAERATPEQREEAAAPAAQQLGNVGLVQLLGRCSASPVLADVAERVAEAAERLARSGTGAAPTPPAAGAVLAAVVAARPDDARRAAASRLST